MNVRPSACALLLALAGAAGCSATGPPATSPTPAVAPAPPTWRPAPGSSWHWQLTTPVDRSIEADVYDIDLFDNDAGVVSALHASDRRVVCYFSAGSWESWRPDAGAFPAEVRGAPNGWPGERWLDVRRIDLLAPALLARLDQCRAKGFDAAEPDNVDGHVNATGFPITPADQLRFNRWLAGAAHDRGLAVALKNDVEQAADLVADFDFAVNEECARYQECDALGPFVAAGKAVFHVEYAENGGACPPRRAGFSSMVTSLALDGPRTACL